MKNKKVFELTQQHIDLLQSAIITNYGFPNMGLDTNYPFGDSNIIDNMAKIVGVQGMETDDEDIVYPKGTYDKMQALWGELEDALTIILRTKSFRPGKYVASEYGSDWKYWADTINAD